MTVLQQLKYNFTEGVVKPFSGEEYRTSFFLTTVTTGVLFVVCFLAMIVFTDYRFAYNTSNTFGALSTVFRVMEYVATFACLYVGLVFYASLARRFRSAKISAYYVYVPAVLFANSMLGLAFSYHVPFEDFLFWIFFLMTFVEALVGFFVKHTDKREVPLEKTLSENLSSTFKGAAAAATVVGAATANAYHKAKDAIAAKKVGSAETAEATAATQTEATSEAATEVAAETAESDAKVEEEQSWWNNEAEKATSSEAPAEATEAEVEESQSWWNNEAVAHDETPAQAPATEATEVATEAAQEAKAAEAAEAEVDATSSPVVDAEVQEEAVAEEAEAAVVEPFTAVSEDDLTIEVANEDATAVEADVADEAGEATEEKK